MKLRRLLAALLMVCALACVAHAQGTLFERLGGERGVTAIVDDWYNRLTADPQLADRFGGPDKAYLKNQYLAYFETLTGGPRNYRGRDVTTIHRHLRVTPQEWDLTISHMQESLNRFQVDALTSRDFINQIQGLRKDIVKASTPVARTLYDRMGGELVLKAVVDDWFDQIIADPSMADRFTGTNLGAIKGEVVNFLGAAIGGPQQYDGRDMKSVHYRMHITADEWAANMNYLQSALAHQHVPEKEGAEFMAIVGQSRPGIVHQ